MEFDVPATRHMTPDEVLAVLLALYGPQVDYDPEFVLHAGTTIDDWQDMCEIFTLHEVGAGCNEVFGTDFKKADWQAVLTPTNRQTVGDVAALIATRAEVSVVEPVTVFSQPCLTAGAFLTFRSVLQQCGVETRDIRPSTPLEPYLRKHPWVLFREAIKLAPGQVPPVEVERPLDKYFLSLFIKAVVSIPMWIFIAATGLQLAGLILEPIAVLLLAIIGCFISALLPPKRVSLGELETFGDLSELLARSQPASVFRRT